MVGPPASAVVIRRRAATRYTSMKCALDPATRSLVYASAGHPGYILDGSGELTTLPGTGPPFGINASEVYPSASVCNVEDGQVVLLLSDGILEHGPAGARPLALARTLEGVRSHREETAQDIATALCKAALGFAGPGKQRDDMSAVVVKAQPRR